MNLHALLPVVVVALAAVAHSDLLIDDFSQGDFTRTFTGVQGQGDGFTDGLDPTHTVGGFRQWSFSYGNNVRGQDITFGNRNGSFEVSWPQGGEPNIVSTTNLEWGTDHANPINLDLSWFTSFEVARHSNPGAINGTGYAIFVHDIHGQDTNNSRWRQRQNEGVGFNRIDFSNPNFDWTQVNYIRFKQEFGEDRSNIHGYFVDELRVVPEPSSVIAVGLAVLLARRCRRAS